MLDPNRFETANRRRLSAPAMRTFLAIADLWGLSEAERLRVLGHIPKSTYQNWAKEAREHREITLPADTLTRLSAVLGVYQMLRILHPSEEACTRWLKTANRGALFGGQTPMTFITGGEIDALLLLRRYLDGARGGMFAPPNAVDEGFKPYTAADIVFR